MSFYAFRQWTVDVDGILAPGMRRTLFRWSATGPTEAVCSCSQPDPLHLTATKRRPGDMTIRRCGLWVHDRPVPHCHCDTPDAPNHGVVGVVRCGGRYVRCAAGWRVQKAIPVAVVDYTGRLSRAYDQIGLRRYPDLETMHGEWFPDDDGRRADVGDRWHDEILQDIQGPSLAHSFQQAAQSITRTTAGMSATVTFTVASEQMHKIMEALGAGLTRGAVQALQQAQQAPPPDLPFLNNT